MELLEPYRILLLVSGAVFLLTAAHIIANLGAAVALFAPRSPQHGDLQADTQGRRRQASRKTMILSIALHIAAIAGAAFAVWAATWETTDTAPGREGLPGEMEPLPDE